MFSNDCPEKYGINENLVPNDGGGVFHLRVPVKARVDDLNCRGTGAQEDFSFCNNENRLKLIPHSSTPSKYRILRNGIANSAIQ